MNPQRSRDQAGFSLVEALVATLLVATIVLGVMPLFTTSIVQNVSGKESTIATNYSRSGTEELVSLPLDRIQLRPPVGQNSQQICQAYENGEWDYIGCTAPILGQPAWIRRTSVQQYNINEIYDGDTAAGIPTFKNPVQGYLLGNDQRDSFVHIRELMVITEGQRTPDSPLGPGRRVDMVGLRGF